MPRKTTVGSSRERARAISGQRLDLPRIVETATLIADRDGLAKLSMRRLGQELGVDPMSVYNHVRDKQELTAAMVDAVVAAIEPLPSSGGWSLELRSLILAARGRMLLHPWAARVIDDGGGPTPATLEHIDRVLGILHRGGFSIELAHHTLHVLGSRVLGFSQDLFDDSVDDDVPAELLERQYSAWETTHPYVAELARAATHDGALGGCDDDAEFLFALDLMLEGLERRRAAA